MITACPGAFPAVQVPTPPVDAVMPATAQLVATVAVYYGYQPYTLFGILPAEWLFINGLAPATTAVLLHRFPELVAGRRWPLALAIPAVTQYAALSVGIPFYSAFNGGASHLGLWLAAGLTIALGVGGFIGLGRLLPATAAVRTSPPVPAHR